MLRRHEETDDLDQIVSQQQLYAVLARVIELERWAQAVDARLNKISPETASFQCGDPDCGWTPERYVAYETLPPLTHEQFHATMRERALLWSQVEAWDREHHNSGGRDRNPHVSRYMWLDSMILRA